MTGQSTRFPPLPFRSLLILIGPRFPLSTFTPHICLLRMLTGEVSNVTEIIAFLHAVNRIDSTGTRGKRKDINMSIFITFHTAKSPLLTVQLLHQVVPLVFRYFKYLSVSREYFFYDDRDANLPRRCRTCAVKKIIYCVGVIS